MAPRVYAPKDVSVQDLIEGNKKLYDDDEYKDLVIVCGKEKIAVHKAIVCSKSDFFKAACRKDTFKEGTENTIDLSADAQGDDASIVQLMIKSLYILDYDVPNPTHSLTTHAKVFAIADKYGVAGLKALAQKKFENAWDSSTRDDVASAIRAVYKTTPDSIKDLREIVKDKLIKSGPALLRAPLVEAAVQSVEGLAWEMFRKTQWKLCSLEERYMDSDDDEAVSMWA